MASEKILAAKQQYVADYAEAMKGSATFVFVSARGLTVEQDTAMRNELRANGVQYHVIKNTMLIRIFKELGFEGLDDTFKGPTAVAYSEDIIAPAKVIAKFAEDFEPLEIKSGIIDGKVSTKEDIIALSKVPDQKTLYSQVVFGMLYPFTKLAQLIKAVAEKDGEAAPAEEAPAAEPATTEA